jgi:uncharacterized protein YwqG
VKALAWILAGIAASSLAVLALKPRRGDVAPARAPEVPTAAAADVEAFLAPQRAALAATRRPMHRIALEAFNEDTPTASKVGGRAWWPADEPDPQAADGTRLILLAQVNFAEVPATPGYPTHGLLQIFIAPDDYYGANFDGATSAQALAEQRHFRVAYWPDLAVPARALPVPYDRPSLPHAPGEPRRMRFTRGDEALSVGDYRFDRLFGGNAYATMAAFAKTRHLDADALWQGVAERLGGTGHKLGGYPYFTQADPRDGGPWELLLQLDTDDAMMWGDAGVANFFIDPQDLARADFRRVLYHWDCH